MESSSYEMSDLIIPAFGANGQTVSLVIDLHPGQVRMLNHAVGCDHLPFREREDVARWCVAFGLYSLLDRLPDASALAAAKINITLDDEFQQRRDCLAISVEKELKAGDHESARRIVLRAVDDYSQLESPYWKAMWLDTLGIPMELLRLHGIPLKAIVNSSSH